MNTYNGIYMISSKCFKDEVINYFILFQSNTQKKYWYVYSTKTWKNWLCSTGKTILI